MEFWDIYDANKNKTGRRMQRNDWNMQPGEFHLTVLGIIQRTDGRFLITKRVETKSWAAGWWEVPGGGVQAGEESREAVLREVREETGLDVSTAEGGYLFTYARENPEEGDNYFVDIYRFRMDVPEGAVHLQENETADYRFATLEEIREIADRGEFLHYDSIQRGFEGACKILIRGGRVIDPDSGSDEMGNLWIQDGVIVAPESFLPEEADHIIEANGDLVLPGFIDLHVHLRDPGQTEKETIATGCAAAAHGGYTTIFAMPNTKPVADNREVIRYVNDTAGKASRVHVHQIGAVTKGQQGKELADYDGMMEAGIIAISEDGKSVMDSGLYREAMKYAAAHDLTVMAHCEDINLVRGGVMNLDENAEKLGLPGISNAVEDIIVSRDILLAKETGARLHLCHCSTADSVTMVKEAKEAGITVSAEVCPHHFSLSTEDIPGDNANYKMNPPLRSKADVEALREGLRDNIMDAISTDHAPHTAEEKSGSMKQSPFGIVGLETAAALTWTNLVEQGYLTPMQMAQKMSYNPAQIARIPGGSLAEGAPADVVILNVTDTYRINAAKFASKGRNTPFDGMEVRGKVTHTICGGEIIYVNE